MLSASSNIACEPCLNPKIFWVKYVQLCKLDCLSERQGYFKLQGCLGISVIKFRS